MLGLTEIALRRKQPKLAQERLTQALAIAPQSADVHTALGRFYFGQGKLAEAEASYKKALSLDKGALQADPDLGDLYLGALHKPKEAVSAYKSALSPCNPQIHLPASG